MIRTNLVFTTILVIGLLAACENNEEEFSYEEPVVVEFVEAVYYPRKEPSAEYELEEPDRLEITIVIHHEFEYGLSFNEYDPPYHELDLIVDSNEDTVLMSNEIQPPLYQLNPAGEKALFSEDDNRIEFNCQDYALINYDSVFVERNPFFYNLIVDLVGSDKNSFFNDFSNENAYDHCSFISGFNTRVPNGSGTTFIFEIDQVNQYRTEISYSIKTDGLRYLINKQPFSIQLAAIDRELNISDTVYVEIMSLQSIEE